MPLCRLYLLDVARMCPPEPPRHNNLAYTVRLLRPELVTSNPEPLSSDAFSKFGAIDHVRTITVNAHTTCCCADV